MAITGDNIVETIGAAIGPVMEVVWVFVQLFLVVGIILYIFIYIFGFPIRVEIYEMSRGGKTIIRTTRAKIARSKSSTPQLRLIGTMDFGGELINQPPSECLHATRSRITTIQYNFIRKDGLYWPINNVVLGSQKEDPDTGNKFYSIDGTGLEVNRDYDAEKAIENKLIEKAHAYRNKKPTEVIASFALMIITVVICGIIMWFALENFGKLAQAVASLNEPLRSGIAEAAQQVLGPN